MSTSPELVHFLALSTAEQAGAIRDLASEGWSDYGIAGATRLSVEQVRKIRRGEHQVRPVPPTERWISEAKGRR